MSLPAKRYAKALYGAAQDNGALEAVAADLKALHEVLGNADISSVLANPAAPAKLTRSVMEKATKDAHPLIQNLAQVMLQRHREPVLAELWPVFDGLLRASRGEAVGIVETALPLGDGDLQRLEALAAKLSGAKVELTAVDNADLIGGVRLRIGNTLYDGSVAHALEQMHKQLMAAPLPTTE